MALQRSDWVAAAAQVLATKGVSAVKIEALARDLGVSKGSFYWHFKNRDDLLEAVLDVWEESTDALIDAANQVSNPQQRLLTLMTLINEMATQNPNETIIDDAIFLWARENAAVRERVLAIEDKRFNFMANLFGDVGYPPADARERADFAYLAFVGFVSRASRDPAYRQGASFLGFANAMNSLLISAEPPPDPL